MNIKKYFVCDEDNLIKVISSTPFISLTKENKDITMTSFEHLKLYNKIKEINMEELRLGFVCNWDQQCGISTYSTFLVNSLKDKVSDYKIFSEYSETEKEDSDNITYCWKRNEPLNNLINELKGWKPDFLIIQHEWGVFPNASYFMKFIIDIEKLNIPYLITTHSIYYHLDKTIPLSVVKNIVVHSDDAKQVLLDTNFQGKINVIPHGCLGVNNKGELWNIFKNPYTVFGYGFGFKYKGVDMAIDSIHYLKNNVDKFKDILYIYICSESENNKGVQ